MWLFSSLGVWLTGGKAIRVTAQNKADYKICNGYVISGGVDISPKSYGQENQSSLNVEPERDNIEFEVITHALKNKKPILGICRGAQMINIVKGGSLYQNVGDFFKSFTPNRSILMKIFARRLVHILKNNALDCFSKRNSKIFVNSIHHQAINKLGNGLEVVAKDNLGIIQAIQSSSNGSYIIGVQWHPEFMLYSSLQRKLFKVLIQNI